jgi:hypothetical protein
MQSVITQSSARSTAVLHSLTPASHSHVCVCTSLHACLLCVHIHNSVGAPRYYLSQESAALIGKDEHFKPYYVLGRIIHIEVQPFRTYYVTVQV